jgi:7,8-dihydropterin-6-yl-methyl-4-(beta-D-ribofuranosyl)aminobenzene 5'-phosphate synthase
MRKRLILLGVASISLVAPTIEPGPLAGDVTMTVVYDNYSYVQGLTTDWGFGCFIEGAEETMLFDTGYQGSILMDNIDALGIDLQAMAAVVISHDHLDHTGGLDSVLNRNSDVSVYHGASFPPSFSQNVIDHGAVPVPVDESIQICDGVLSTGELQGPVNEQSLVLDSDQGLVIITGCSHPGIVNILNTAKQLSDKDIYLVFGGFHLGGHTVAQIQQIIQQFRALGVQKVGPTHCTGETAISLFQQEYGDDFVNMGVGRTITVSMSPLPAREEDQTGSLLPGRLGLQQNFPNPFTGETVIRYCIPVRSHVALDVYDIRGRKLASLVNDVAPAGGHFVRWNPAGTGDASVPGGTCICSIRAAGFRDTIRMVRAE